jgi:hypothetical protein
MDGSQSILKRDGRGRVCTPVERREALLDEFERSGLSGPRFAALAGVKYQTLAWWRHERRRKRGLPAPIRKNEKKSPGHMALRLVEAVVGRRTKPHQERAAAVTGALQVHLAGGVRIEIADPAQLKLAVSLLKALGMERPC